METRIKQMISILVNQGKLDTEQESNLQYSLKDFYESTNNISYMNVGDRYLDMTVHTAIGVGSDRVYLVKKDNDEKFYVLNAYKKIINGY
jgi:electron transfer flavoprotein alpha/beta subunit